MPTGYTASIYENKETTFEEFVWHCARNFGALLHLRDEPCGAPTLAQALSDSWGSNWHEERLVEAKAHLATIQAMTPQEMDAQRLVRHDQAWSDFRRQVSETNLLRGRYQTMLYWAKAWQPPTSAHENLRTFMIQQIEESLRWDCHPTSPGEMPDLDVFRRNLVERATANVTYHAYEAEKARIHEEQKREWVRALHASVPNPRL